MLENQQSLNGTDLFEVQSRFEDNFWIHELPQLLPWQWKEKPNENPYPKRAALPDCNWTIPGYCMDTIDKIKEEREGRG